MIDKYMYHKYCYTYRVSYQSSDDKYNQTMRRNGFQIHMGDGKRRGLQPMDKVHGYVMVYKTCWRHTVMIVNLQPIAIKEDPCNPSIGMRYTSERKWCFFLHCAHHLGISKINFISSGLSMYDVSETSESKMAQMRVPELAYKFIWVLGEVHV